MPSFRSLPIGPTRIARPGRNRFIINIGQCAPRALMAVNKLVVSLGCGLWLYDAQGPQRDCNGIDHGLYAAGATEATYQELAMLARKIVGCGLIAIVDATCRRRWQRDLFRHLAAELGVAFVIVHFVASNATLRRRIVERAATGKDASDADLVVLDQQLRSCELLTPEEWAFVVPYDGEAHSSGRANWMRGKRSATASTPRIDNSSGIRLTTVCRAPALPPGVVPD